MGEVAEILGGEAASLREAPLPPDPSLPKSGWRLGWDDSLELVPPERWVRFLAAWLSPRRLTEPPRTCEAGTRKLDTRKADGLRHRLFLYRRMRRVRGMQEYSCGGGISSTIRSANDPPPPSAEGGKGVCAAKEAAGVRASKRVYPQSAFG